MKGHRFLIARSIALPPRLLLSFIPRPFPNADYHRSLLLLRRSFDNLSLLIPFVVSGRSLLESNSRTKGKNSRERSGTGISVTGYTFGFRPQKAYVRRLGTVDRGMEEEGWDRWEMTVRADSTERSSVENVASAWRRQ